MCILFIPAGATQVRWNRLSRYLLATAHDGDIKLWDQRKGTAPVQYIAAHLSKVGIYCAVFLFLCTGSTIFLVFLRHLHVITILWNPSRLTDRGILICSSVP